MIEAPNEEALRDRIDDMQSVSDPDWDQVWSDAEIHYMGEVE